MGILHSVRIIRRENQAVPAAYIKEFWMLCGVYVREYIVEYAEDMVDDQKVSYNIILTDAVDCNKLEADITTKIDLTDNEDLSGKNKRMIFGKKIENQLLPDIDTAADLKKVYAAFVNCDYAFLDYTTHLFVTQFSSEKKLQRINEFIKLMGQIYLDGSKFSGSRYKKFSYLNIGRKINRIAREGSLRLYLNTKRLVEEAHRLNYDKNFSIGDVLAGLAGVAERETERDARIYLHNAMVDEQGQRHQVFLCYALGHYYEVDKKDFHRAWIMYDEMRNVAFRNNYRLEFKIACRLYYEETYKDACEKFYQLYQHLEKKVESGWIQPLELEYFYKCARILTEMPREYRGYIGEEEYAKIKSPDIIANEDFENSKFNNDFFDKKELAELKTYFKSAMEGHRFRQIVRI